MTRKPRRPAWVGGPIIERHLGLLRWLARRGEWVSTKEFAAHTYGESNTQRRTLHRDVARLVEAGVPIEGAYGCWRLTPRAFAAWLRRV